MEVIKSILLSGLANLPLAALFYLFWRMAARDKKDAKMFDERDIYK